MSTFAPAALLTHARDRADTLFGVRAGSRNHNLYQRMLAGPAVDRTAFMGRWPVSPWQDYRDQGYYDPTLPGYAGTGNGYGEESSRVAADDAYGRYMAPTPPPAPLYYSIPGASSSGFSLAYPPHVGLAPGGEARRGQLRRRAERKAREAYEARFDAQVLADAHQRGQDYWADLAERRQDLREGITHDAPMRSYFRGDPRAYYLADGRALYASGVEGLPTMVARRFSYPPRSVPAAYLTSPWYR